MEIKSKIKFGNSKILSSYKKLEDKQYQENILKKWLHRAFEDLEKNAFCGIQIPKKIIPKEYTKKFGELKNLWKYNLPNSWRLIYTIKSGETIILSIILEWLTHKDYTKRFSY